ncbi:hypothetical protein AVEN_106302-1 [Araneus ventricosus]|uniref:Secreted protein n=1 Tax=Araneus ventricosus TaxID=182803 RepID=A0A4Y2AUH4_ARAVE|nr:hypothetical protein AVEN_106302-1 [Araneus ventricosus]
MLTNSSLSLDCLLEILLVFLQAKHQCGTFCLKVPKEGTLSPHAEAKVRLLSKVIPMRSVSHWPIGDTKPSFIMSPKLMYFARYTKPAVLNLWVAEH